MPDGSSRLSPLPASPTWPPYAPRKPLWTRRPGGPDWMPITPKTGSLFHADSQTASSVDLLTSALPDDLGARPVLSRTRKGWPYRTDKLKLRELLASWV